MEPEEQTDILEALIAINDALFVLARNLPPDQAGQVISDAETVLAVCNRMLNRKKARTPGLLGIYGVEPGNG